MYQFFKERGKKSKIKLYAVVARAKSDNFIQVVCRTGNGEGWSKNWVVLHSRPPTHIIDRLGKNRTSTDKHGDIWEYSIVRVNSKNCPFTIDWTAKTDGAYNHKITIKEGYI